MATIEHDWRDPPEQPRQPDDPGTTRSRRQVAAKVYHDESGVPRVIVADQDLGPYDFYRAVDLANRIRNALANCDDDGTPLAWPSRATMAMVFIGGLIAGAIGMAVLLTGVEWVR